MRMPAANFGQELRQYQELLVEAGLARIVAIELAQAAVQPVGRLVTINAGMQCQRAPYDVDILFQVGRRWCSTQRPVRKQGRRATGSKQTSSGKGHVHVRRDRPTRWNRRLKSQIPMIISNLILRIGDTSTDCTQKSLETRG